MHSDYIVPRVPTNPIILYHVTGLRSAISILEEKVFHPNQEHPLGSDSGLNAFEVERKYNKDQCYNEEGTAVFFEWTGPYRNQDELPFEPNVLVRQGAWRSVIPFQSNRYLRMIRIEAEIKEWEALHKPAPWWLMLRSFKMRWLLRKAMITQIQVQNLLSVKPFIGVAIKPESI